MTTSEYQLLRSHLIRHYQKSGLSPELLDELRADLDSVFKLGQAACTQLLEATQPTQDTSIKPCFELEHLWDTLVTYATHPSDDYKPVLEQAVYDVVNLDDLDRRAVEAWSKMLGWNLCNQLLDILQPGDWLHRQEAQSPEALKEREVLICRLLLML